MTEPLIEQYYFTRDSFNCQTFRGECCSYNSRPMDVPFEIERTIVYHKARIIRLRALSRLIQHYGIPQLEAWYKDWYSDTRINRIPKRVRNYFDPGREK